MTLKNLVDQYLSQNFYTIEAARHKDGFSWKPILVAINHPDLNQDDSGDREYVRNRFLQLRYRHKAAVVATNTITAIPVTKSKRLINDIEAQI